MATPIPDARLRTVFIIRHGESRTRDRTCPRPDARGREPSRISSAAASVSRTS